MERVLKQGFSIIEVIVALTVLAIVLLPFLNVVAYRVSKEHENDEMMDALDLGRETMEKLLSRDEVMPYEIMVNGKFIVRVSIYTNSDRGALDELTVVILRQSDNAVLVRLCSLK